MSNTVFQVRRNSTSGVKPTTASIQPGELALNLPDGILYSTNGSAVFQIGANLSTISVTGNVTFSNTIITANGSTGTAGQVLTTNGSTGNVYWSTVSSSGSSTANAVSNTVTANGSVGTAGQVLTSGGPGGNVYWSSATTASGVGVTRQSYTGDGSTSTFTFTSGYVSGNLLVYINGLLLDPADFTATNGTSFTLTVTPISGVTIDAVNINAATTPTFIAPRSGTATFGNPMTLNWASYDYQTVTLTGSTTITNSGAVDGQSLTLYVKQDSTGSRIITWASGTVIPTMFTGAITLSTAPNAIDMIGLVYRSATSTYNIVAFVQGIG
jgi:hypothetical protein